jgi:hypothetical protein
MIRSSPNQPIASGTDWRFLDPLDPFDSSCLSGCGRQAAEGGMRRRILVDEEQEDVRRGGK